MPVPVSAPTPIKREQPTQAPPEQAGEAEEEKPKKRVSRFKKERMGA